MSSRTRVGHPLYGLLPADVEGFDSLAELALDLRWSWNHATDQVWRQLDPVTWCQLDATPDHERTSFGGGRTLGKLASIKDFPAIGQVPSFNPGWSSAMERMNLRKTLWHGPLRHLKGVNPCTDSAPS